MTEIRVPTLGESVTEATIGRWFKKAGEAVAVDEPLVELETDKVTIEVPAPSAGVLGEIAAKDGDTVAVGALLGMINDGAAAPAAKPAAAAPAKAPRLPLRLPPRPPRPRRRRQMRRWRLRCASFPPKAASMPPPCRAPARTAASPRATCWPRSRRPPPRRPRSISRPPPCRCAAPRRPMTPRAKNA